MKHITLESYWISICVYMCSKRLQSYVLKPPLSLSLSLSLLSLSLSLSLSRYDFWGFIMSQPSDNVWCVVYFLMPEQIQERSEAEIALTEKFSSLTEFFLAVTENFEDCPAVRLKAVQLVASALQWGSRAQDHQLQNKSKSVRPCPKRNTSCALAALQTYNGHHVRVSVKSTRP